MCHREKEEVNERVDGWLRRGPFPIDVAWLCQLLAALGMLLALPL